MKLRLVGDVHGDHQAINQMMQSCHHYDLTIQLGDFGVGFGAEAYLNNVSPDTLRVLHGNHDDPQLLAKYPHDLGRFGVYKFGDKNIFYVAGAWSIDFKWRTPGISWWNDEELSLKEAGECLDLWEKICNDIDIVISHDGPPHVTALIKGEYPIETNTGRILYEMWKIHEPPHHLFGHWHKSFSKKINNTHYRCLSINEEFVFDFI